MHGINEKLKFIPIRIALLTVSDTRTRADDVSGDTLSERVTAAGHNVADRQIVRDDIGEIQGAVSRWIADPEVDAIVTTGGTGLTGRDVTPEAVAPLLDKKIDGFSVLFHMVSFESVGLSTLQSRATAGVSNGTYVFCLPGSPGAVKDGWDKVIRMQFDSRHRPCNLVEMMPRLSEK